jgi:hypothetical protein
MLANTPDGLAGTGLSLEYLAASGAVPISVTERDGVCRIHAGKEPVISPAPLSRWWLSAPMMAPP